MLAKHERKSRGRMFAGVGATAALLVGGLGLTASGTQAAETVRASMESAVGVDLASLDLPKLAQAEPLPPPPPPPVGAAPAAPEAPVAAKHVRVILRDKDGKLTEVSDDDGDHRRGDRVEHRRYVFRGKDGKAMAWEGGPEVPMPPEIAEKLKTMRIAMRNMPEISSRTCSDGEGRGNENVINRKDGDKRITIICTNRIERLASLAALDAERAGAHTFVMRRHAEGSALEGLRNARRSVEANRDMTENQRAAALSGIDQAIREMESQKDD